MFFDLIGGSKPAYGAADDGLPEVDRDRDSRIDMGQGCGVVRGRVFGDAPARRETAMVSDLEYARAGDGTHVAYRVLGAAAECDAPRDVVMVSGGLIPMEVFEDDPGFVRLLAGLRSLGRVVVFDRRGIGLSDPIVDWERPILDQWADDLSAVIESLSLPPRMMLLPLAALMTSPPALFGAVV